jgi:hypothetical protein
LQTKNTNRRVKYDQISLNAPRHKSSSLHSYVINDEGKKYKSKAGCFKTESDIEPVLVFCRETKVHTTGGEFKTDWGLYNRFLEKLICFFPKYIVVEFLQFCSPPWVKEHPKLAPIPVLELYGQKCCFQMKYTPLGPVQTKKSCFQGKSVGQECVIPCKDCEWESFFVFIVWNIGSFPSLMT